MKRLRVLDLFCCAGGAARGYAAAGFDVLGVDIVPRPNYPFEFVRSDALEYLRHQNLEPFGLIHASPPCQGYSQHVSSRSSRWVPTLGKDEPRLIAGVRELLIESGRPYVIENVMGARSEMNANLVLCGVMFGLHIPRHRLFECSWPIEQPPHLYCHGEAKRYAAERGWEYRDVSVTGKGRRKGTADRWRELLGITDTSPMTQSELSEAIPPAYTQYIGTQLANFLSR